MNRPNLSSIVSVLLLRVSDIDVFPELNLERDETNGAITLVAGGAWEDVEFTKHTAVLTEKSVGRDVWEVELKGTQFEEDVLRNDHLQHRYVADVTTGNGDRLLLGTDKQPLTLQLQHGTGTPQSGNKTALVLKGMVDERPPVYAP